MRRAAEVLPTTEDAGPIDEIDLEFARDRMRNGKAPGLDIINPELIKQGWDLLAPHILYECTKYHSLRGKLRELALVEGVDWPPPVDF